MRCVRVCKVEVKPFTKNFKKKLFFEKHQRIKYELNKGIKSNIYVLMIPLKNSKCVGYVGYVGVWEKLFYVEQHRHPYNTQHIHNTYYFITLLLIVLKKLTYLTHLTHYYYYIKK